MNNLSSSGSTLEKFAEKIDFANLNGEPEDIFKTGLAFVENGQFDDGIIEFVKIIKTIPHQEELFSKAETELISMGFSTTDIHLVAGIHKPGITSITSNSETGLQNANSDDLPSLTNAEALSETDPKAIQDALANHKTISFIYILLTSIILIMNCGGLFFGLAVVGEQAIIEVVVMPLLIVGGCIYVSRYFISENNIKLGNIILYSAPVLVWLYLIK